MLEIYRKYPFLFFSVFYIIVVLYVLVNYNGTVDSGDSVLHYLYAKESWSFPQNLFHHWAKPLFTLIASPFAQFGFTGIKIFNCLATFFSCYFTFKTTEILQLKNDKLAPIFTFLAPLTFITTFSGLTEPLFALFCILSLYLSLKNQFIFASILLSFLPFVRSEGFIIMGVFGLYFLLHKQFKTIFFLATGHIVYSIIGGIFLSDFLWIFNHPYQSSTNYGSGDLLHFMRAMAGFLGIPLLLLFVFGVVSAFKVLMKEKLQSPFVFIVCGCFVAFFVAHSLFWYLGIFHSMGLKRVLVCTSPFAAIICLHGFNFLTAQITRRSPNLSKIIMTGILAYVCIFPFTSNRSAIEPSKTLTMSNDQKNIVRIKAELKRRNIPIQRLAYTNTFVAITFNISYFDTTQTIVLGTSNFQKLRKGDVIIWDDWFSVVEGGINKDFLMNQNDLEFLFSKTIRDEKHPSEFRVYLKK
jgi:hypothetical protein